MYTRKRKTRSASSWFFNVLIVIMITIWPLADVVTSYFCFDSKKNSKKRCAQIHIFEPWIFHHVIFCGFAKNALIASLICFMKTSKHLTSEQRIYYIELSVYLGAPVCLTCTVYTVQVPFLWTQIFLYRQEQIRLERFDVPRHRGLNNRM